MYFYLFTVILCAKMSRVTRALEALKQKISLRNFSRIMKTIKFSNVNKVAMMSK
jgi:hypothetical protein